MVKVGIRGWGLHYADECPHKDGCTNLCMCVCFEASLYLNLIFVLYVCFIRFGLPVPDSSKGELTSKVFARGLMLHVAEGFFFF